MTELKPCPFCGERGIAHRVPTGWRVSCTRCDCQPRPSFPPDTEAEAIAVWNTRAVPRATGDDGELVKRLRYTYEHGIFVAAEKGMLAGADEAADCIEALSVEMERLREALAEIEADCEADYPPSHGAIKYTARQALGAKP